MERKRQKESRMPSAPLAVFNFSKHYESATTRGTGSETLCSTFKRVVAKINVFFKTFYSTNTVWNIKKQMKIREQLEPQHRGHSKHTLNELDQLWAALTGEQLKGWFVTEIPQTQNSNLITSCCTRWISTRHNHTSVREPEHTNCHHNVPPIFWHTSSCN